MIRLARFVVAMPGKTFEVLAAMKEATAVVRKVTGAESKIFTSFGSKVGEIATVSEFSSLADFEERMAKLLASPEYQAAIKRFEGLVVPGESRDHLLREIG